MKYLSLDGLKQIYTNLNNKISNKRDLPDHRIDTSDTYDTTDPYLHVCDIYPNSTYGGYPIIISFFTRYVGKGFITIIPQKDTDKKWYVDNGSSVGGTLNAWVVSSNTAYLSVYVKCSGWWNSLKITDVSPLWRAQSIVWTNDMVAELPSGAIKLQHDVDGMTVGSGLEVASNGKLLATPINNVLKPTMQTTSQNGITCTNNGDGTYTVDGTATADVFFTIAGMKLTGTYKILGAPKSEVVDKFYIGGQKVYHAPYSGVIQSYDNVYIDYEVAVTSGTTVDKALVKPMITTNLNATYDDFVPYTGDNGNLSKDVASLLRRVEELEKKITNTASE